MKRRMPMRDVFISHVEEDADVALEIARGLEAAGYSTWYYERDSIPGPSYLLQTGDAVEACQAVVLIISPDSLGARQVTAEVERAHESGRLFVPVLRGISHVEFQARQPIWRQAVGSATSVPVPPEGAKAIVPRLVAGLKGLHVQPGAAGATTEVGATPPVVEPGVATVPPVVHRPPATTLRKPGPAMDARVWMGLAGVGILLLVVLWVAFAHPFGPRPGATPTALVAIGGGMAQPTAAPTLGGGAVTQSTAAPVVGGGEATHPTIAPASGGEEVAQPTQGAGSLPPLQVTTLAIEESGSGYAWSPDGKMLVIGGSTMRLYDPQALKEIQSLSTNYGSHPVFSPDGSLLALVSSDGVELWDTAGWGPFLTLAGSKDTTCAAFSPDGKMLATATGQVVKVWDVTSGQELRTIPADGNEVVAFSPDGHTLAAPSGAGGDIKLWDATTGEELRTLEGHSNWIKCLTFSRDGTLLASSSVDQTARLWDVASGRPVRTLMGHSGQVDGVAFSPDGRLVATASWDLTVRLWDAASGQELQRLTGHTSWIDTVAFSPDGSMLVSGGFSEMRLWSLSAEAPSPAPVATPLPTVAPPALSASAISPENAAQLTQLQSVEGDGIKQVAFSPNGSKIALASYHIFVYDARDLKLTQRFDQVQWVWSIAFSPDGSMLVSPTGDGVTLWDAEGAGPLATLTGSKDSESVGFSPDGALVAASCGQAVKLWDVASGRELYTWPSISRTPIAFSPVDPLVAAGAGDYSGIALWDATTGETVRTLSGLSNYPAGIAFSRNGELLAGVAVNETAIRVWEVATGRAKRLLTAPEVQVKGLAFSPDGRLLAAGSGIAIVIWDLESGDEVCTLTGHSGPVSTVAFSPDGALLASGSDDGTLRLWGIAP